MCSTNEITKTDVYIQKEHEKNLYSFFEKFFFLVSTKEIAFKHFPCKK